MLLVIVIVVTFSIPFGNSFNLSNHCIDESLWILISLMLICITSYLVTSWQWLNVLYYPQPQEKLRESLKVCMKGEPWTLLALAKFFSIGIVVDLKIHLISVAPLLLTPHMMTDLDAMNLWFTFSVEDSFC